MPVAVCLREDGPSLKSRDSPSVSYKYSLTDGLLQVVSASLSRTLSCWNKTITYTHNYSKTRGSRAVALRGKAGDKKVNKRGDSDRERNGRRVDQREGGMIMPNKLPSLLPRLSLWALEHAMSSGSALPTCTPVSSIHSFRDAAIECERQWLQQRVFEICSGEIVWAWKQKQCRRRQHAEKWMLSSSGLQLRFEPFLSFLLWVIRLFKYVGSTDKRRFLHVYRFFTPCLCLLKYRLKCSRDHLDKSSGALKSSNTENFWGSQVRQLGVNGVNVLYFYGSSNLFWFWNKEWHRMIRVLWCSLSSLTAQYCWYLRLLIRLWKIFKES